MTMPKNHITDEQVDAALAVKAEQLVTNPTPEALYEGRDNYGLLVKGDVVVVENLRKARKQLREDLENSQTPEQDEEHAREVARRIAQGFGKTGEAVMVNLVDKPVEGVKLTGKTLGSTSRNLKERAKDNHASRLQRSAQRKQEREAKRKERKEQAARKAKEEAHKVETDAAKRKANLRKPADNTEAAPLPPRTRT